MFPAIVMSLPQILATRLSTPVCAHLSDGKGIVSTKEPILRCKSDRSARIRALTRIWLPWGLNERKKDTGVDRVIPRTVWLKGIGPTGTSSGCGCRGPAEIAGAVLARVDSPAI